MRHTFVTILAVLVLIPSSFALAQTLQTCPAGATWCTSGLYGTSFQNQTTGANPNSTLTSPSTGVPGSVSGYVPLEPILNQWGGTKYNTFSDYLATMYKLAITVGALIAVVMLVTSGVRYMLSESFTDKDKARKRIVNALWGLVIVVGSFLILYSINPNLLRFNLAPPPVTQKASNFTVATGGSSGNTTQISGYPGASIGTATGDQMRQAGALLNSRLIDDRYVLFDPTQMSSAQLNATMQSYKEYCEQSGVVSTLSFGSIHYYSRTVPGTTFGGASGSSALVCTDNP